MTLVSNLRQKLADTEPRSARYDLQVADANSGSVVNMTTLQSDALSCLVPGAVRPPLCSAWRRTAAMG